MPPDKSKICARQGAGVRRHRIVNRDCKSGKRGRLYRRLNILKFRMSSFSVKRRRAGAPTPCGMKTQPEKTKNSDGKQQLPCRRIMKRSRYVDHAKSREEKIRTAMPYSRYRAALKRAEFVTQKSRRRDGKNPAVYGESGQMPTAKGTARMYQKTARPTPAPDRCGTFADHAYFTLK